MQPETGSLVDNDILLLLEQKSPEPPKSAAKPLPFERLAAGVASRSQSWLFQLPFDILDEIFNYIPHPSLPFFALASRDCCRLARGRQFANVNLDYSPNSWSLAHGLLSEATLGHYGANQSVRVPRIGPNIRQISICTAKEYIQQYHRTSIWEPRSIGAEKLAEIEGRYKHYVRTVQLVLASSLPNIKTIIWADRVSFDAATYQALYESRAQNVVLNEVTADGRFSLDGCTAVWPIQTLYLGVADVPSHWLRKQASVLCNTLIRLSAPHLESLTWIKQRGTSGTATLFSKNAEDCLQFPALKNIQIFGLGLADSSVLAMLIRSAGQLRWLGIQCSHLGDYPSKCGTLSSLESLTWLPLPLEGDDTLLSFLQDNTHLKELHLRKAYATDVLDGILLPLLGSSFKCLTSLFIIAHGAVLEESSLELIGKIATLELLHLSAGDQQFSFQWIVDHEAIRRNLSNLPKLKSLFLSRDVRTVQSLSSSENNDDDRSSMDSDDDTSSMDFGNNPNSDLDAIIAAVTHGAIINAGTQQANQGINHDEHSPIESDTSDDNIGWDLATSSRQPFSIPGSGIESSSLSRLLQRMRDEKLEQEVQKYFSIFNKLEMIYIGRQAFDRGYDELTGLLWRNKRWADLEDLLPLRASMRDEYGLQS